MAQLFTLPQQVRLNSSGTPYAGAQAYFYRANTLTAQSVYTTPDLGTPHANPVSADAAGQFPAIWLDSDADYDYRVQVKTAAGVLLDDYTVTRSALSAEQVGRALYPLTPEEQAAGVSPADYSYAPGNLLRYGGDPTGANASDDAFAKWLASLEKLNSANPQGEAVIPPGNYKLTTGLTFSSTMKLRADGAQLDFSGASSSVTAVTIVAVSQGVWTDATIGDPLGGLSILGPGTSGTSIGVTVVGTTGYPSKFPLRVSAVSEFARGFQQGSNSWNFYFQGGWWLRNHINVYFPTGLTNSAENVQFFGTVLSESVTCSLRSYGNSLDINFFGGSVDYDDAYGVDVDGDTVVNFYGTHFENSGDKKFITNLQLGGNPAVNLFGCAFVQASGSATAELIDADQIHLTVDGGWYRGAGTQATFVKSSGAYDLYFRQPIVAGSGTVTSWTDIAGGTGKKVIELNGASGYHRHNTPIRVANNVALQMEESGGTSRDLFKLNSSNVLEIGNSNNATALNLKQIVSGFYGLVANGLGTNFGIYFRTAGGAPSGGEVGIEQGSILLNQADKKLYVNTGTNASATWTAQA